MTERDPQAEKDLDDPQINALTTPSLEGDDVEEVDDPRVEDGAEPDADN